MMSNVIQQFYLLERDFVFDGKTVHIKSKMWDSSGQERFRDIVVSSAKNTNGIFLIHDVTSQKSFDDLQGWIESIEKAKDIISVVSMEM